MNKALLITVDVEEWYHSQWFDVNKITKDPPSLCAKDTDQVIGLFKALGVQATFFVLGEIAERWPSLVEKIVEAGHEVACHGYTHFSVGELGRQEFSNQIKKARASIEHVAGQKILGYRAPNFGISCDLANFLEEAGFYYDSSIMPCLKIPYWYGQPTAPLTPYRPSRLNICKRDENRDFWEVPISVLPFLRFPGGGGWFLRNIGYPWTRTVVKSLLKRGPAVIYVHPWELSDNNPRFKSIPAHVFRRTGQYVRNAVKNLVRSVEARPISIETFLENV
jgi:polysaccharide deacetylase family protein (PEP-CTERM system associated)